MKKNIFVVFISIILVFTMTSCQTINSVLLYIGIDTHNYSEEEVIAIIDTSDELIEKFTDIIKMITLDTKELSEFSSPKEVSELYTDEILSYLLLTRYTKYNGNPSLLAEVEAEYPGLYATTTIPASDFDLILQKYFGAGSGISHHDGQLFRFLKKADMYITEAQPVENHIEVIVLSCVETERTYRMTFKNTLKEESSPEYTAVFEKRESGDPYLKILIK